MGPEALVAYLRQLPDVWESWLVYADVLSDRGDVRGQLLVLEHRLAAPLPATEAFALRAQVETLATDWMATWRGHLRSDDVHQYETFRRLAPLVAEGGAVFACPVSQLLALLAPGDSGEGLSPVFELHRARVVTAVLDWIGRAFDGVPVPDEDHRTLHQAEAADDYEACDRSRDHLGRWQDLPDDHLLRNQWALAHLDEQGIRYYLPAAMSFALRQRTPHPDDRWLTESLEYTLDPSSAELRDYQRRRFGLLDRGQRAAIHAFALLRGHAKAASAWGRVYEAERRAERVDWFELYSPM